MQDELLVILSAMMPIGELRAAIPLAIGVYDIPWRTALLLSIIGNMLPVPFLVASLKIFGELLEKRPGLPGSILRWRKTHLSSRVDKYSFWGIVLLVAIPLPFTGAWTGSFALWAFNAPLIRGLIAIALGIVIAGIIVTVLTLTGVELIKFL